MIAGVALMAGIGVLSNIPYIAGSCDPKQALDLYVPAADSTAGACPVALFIHGGVWAMGDRADFANVGRALARHGILAAVMSYRLAPKALHPAQVEDVASATAWLAEHAAEHGGDASRITLAGHSAGAQLAALLAVDGRWLAARGLRAGRVRIVALSGIFDLEQPFGDPGQDTGKDYVERVFGPRGPAWREASPIRYVKSGDEKPFIYLVMAERDYAGIRAQTQLMKTALAGAGWFAGMTDIPDRNHYDLIGRIGSPGDPTTELLARLVRERR